MTKMRKIVVTGSTGFIGQSLIKALAAEDGGNKILTLERNKHSLLDKDSLNSLLESSDVVFHLAGIVDSNSPDLFNVNVIGTNNLLEVLAAQKRPVKLIFASSFAIYQPASTHLAVSENDSPKPPSKYGLSKLLAEEIVNFYTHKSVQLDSFILRLANVYGPGAKPFGHSVIATFVEQIKTNQPITINGQGLQTRDFIYIDDVVSAMLKAMNSQFKPDTTTLNICSGREVSIKDLLTLIAQVSNSKPTIEYIKTGSTTISDFSSGNNQKAFELLDWKPKVDLADGLARII